MQANQKSIYPEARQRIEELFEFIDNSPTPYHAALNEALFLEQHGFNKLNWNDEWNFKPGEKYYLIIDGETFISFVVGSSSSKGFRMIGTHNDSPTLRIKSNPEIRSEGFKQLNVEPYGGLIYRDWFDRPLSVAGRLLLRGENNTVNAKIINIDKNCLIIPSLAIHMDRGINDGEKINPQKELIPIYASADDNTQDFLSFVADYVDVRPEDILDYDLTLYPRQKGEFVGTEDEFYSIGRLDNLLMTHQALTAMGESCDVSNSYHRLFVSFDNEEIGSATYRGADSSLLRNVLERIILASGGSSADFLRSLGDSFLISTDVSHAVHPNYPEMADPTNRPRLNKGPVLKIAANKTYNTVGATAARFRLYAENAGVPVQTFYNRSDKRGGSTIGPIAEKWLAVPGADIGIPILSMHAIREMGGVLDHNYSIKIMKEFLESEY